MRILLTAAEEAWCAAWEGEHTDAYHRSSRDTCAFCQEAIARLGDMPPRATLIAYQQLLKARRAAPSPKQAIAESLRWDIWERDNFTCQHCGSRRYLSVDHIVPESRGGTLDPANLQTLCRSCNSAKGARQ